MKLYILVTVIISPLLLSSCDSDFVNVSNEGAPPTRINTGVFIDSTVENIAYSTVSQSGFTNNAGEFNYLDNEVITFSIGSVNLPSTETKPVITPMDIVGTEDIDHPVVLNIARLLLSLDIDANPNNGIRIADEAHTQAQSESIMFDSPTFEDDVINLVANSGSETTTLVDVATAQRHLASTFGGATIADGVITNATGALAALAPPGTEFSTDFVFEDNLMSGRVLLSGFCFNSDTVGLPPSSESCPGDRSPVPLLAQGESTYTGEPSVPGTAYNQEGTTFDRESGQLNLLAFSPSFGVNIAITVFFEVNGTGTMRADAGFLGTAEGTLEWNAPAIIPTSSRTTHSNIPLL